MNDLIDVKVQITDYMERDNDPFPKITISSVFTNDDLVYIATPNDIVKVKASELIKAAQLCSNNRW